jgi:uncharacterized Tic20 family protein
MAEGDNPASGAPATAPPANKDERMWNMLCHLAAFLPIPFGNVLGPFLVWQIKKNEFPSVEGHAKEALNFQITLLIALAGAFVIALLTFGLGVILLPAVGVCGIVLVIIAALKANNGEPYRYPFTIRFLK